MYYHQCHNGLNIVTLLSSSLYDCLNKYFKVHNKLTFLLFILSLHLHHIWQKISCRCTKHLYAIPSLEYLKTDTYMLACIIDGTSCKKRWTTLETMVSYSLVQVHISQIFGRFFRQGDLLIIEYHPAAIFENMANIMADHGGGSHMTDECHKFIFCVKRK